MTQMSAFIDAFVAPHRRGRYRALGGVPPAALCHDLEHDFDPRFVVEVPSHARSAVGPLLRSMTDRRECACVSRWLGETAPIEEAVLAPNDTLCLIEPGRIAYYIAEASGGGGPTYLLLRDERNRRDATAVFEQLEQSRTQRRRGRRR